MSVQRTLRVLRAASLFAVSFLAVATASTAAPRWIRATPFGGSLATLAQAPSAPRVLYTAALNGRLFRSLDDGATWHRRKWTEDYLIAGLVVDPGDAQTVYARTYGLSLLFRTRDGGLTWSRIAPELEVFALATDKDHPGVLFAGTRTGLYRSDDSGDSWRLAALDGLPVSGVAVDPHATDTLFAVIEGSFAEEPTTLWKSTNRGTTWTTLTLPMPLGYLGPPHFVFDPVRPETLYLFFTGEFTSVLPVLRSTDGGLSWSELPAARGVRDLVVLPEGTLFAGTDIGLARSDDGGATWTPRLEPGFPAGPPFDTFRQLLVSAAAPGELLAAGASGIWKSSDHGAGWAASNQGLLAQGASEVEVSPTGPPAVFALAGFSLFRSSDQGDTWTRLQSYLDGPQPYVIEAFDPHHPRTVYGIDTDGQSGYPVATTNGGRRWAKLPIPYTCENRDSVCDVTLTTVALAPQDPETILAGGVFFFHFQGHGNFLLRSVDGGQTWQELKPIEEIGDLVIDPRRRDTYHAVSCTSLFRSTDAGATWKKTGRGLPEYLCAHDERKPVLVIDPQDARRFYLATLSHGVFVSSDAGATFRAMNRGLETAPVVTLRIDPTDSSKLYAGVARQGVFRWSAEQRRWTPLNRGLPLTHFTGIIVLDPRQPSLLYAASPEEGVFRLDLENTLGESK